MAEKYQNYDCGDTGQVMHVFEGILAEKQRYAQTFTPSTAHSVTQVAMRLRQKGTAPTPYTVGIFATSGGLPTGDALASAEFVTTGITTDLGGEMKLITLDSPTNLSAGIVYAIKLIGAVGEGSINNCIQWYYAPEGNPYADGQACESIGGLPWEAKEDADAGFEEWGNPAPPVGAMGKVRGFDFRGRGFRP